MVREELMGESSERLINQDDVVNVVDEPDKEEIGENDYDDDDVANMIADSISEFGKSIAKCLEKSSSLLSQSVHSLKSDKVFDDSRRVMNELEKMNLTEQELFTAAEKILSVPHRLHIFWGCDDVKRFAYVKSLI